MPRKGAALAFHVLHIVAGELQPREPHGLRRHLRHIQRIVNRNRAFGRKRGKQRVRLLSRQRVRKRFEKGVAARYVAECLDL